MAADIHSKDLKVGVGKQAAWATPLTEIGTYYLMPYDLTGVSIEPAVEVGQFAYYTAGGIMEENKRKYIEATSGLSKINFAGVAMVERLAPHFVGALQIITEAALTPFAKDMYPADTIIDFAADGGRLHTIAAYTFSGANYDGILLDNAIIDNLTFTVDANAIGISRLARIAGSWVGNKMTPTQDLSGATFTALPATPYYFPNALNPTHLTWVLNLVINGVTYSATAFRRFEFAINNNVYSDIKTTGGKANNYKMNPEIIYTIDLPYNTTTHKIFDGFVAGGNVAMDFGNGTGNGTAGIGGDIKFDTENGVLISNPQVYEGDYKAIRIQFKALRPSAGWNAQEVGLCDDTDWGY